LGNILLSDGGSHILGSQTVKGKTSGKTRDFGKLWCVLSAKLKLEN
jgi:hypothetical protein